MNYCSAALSGNTVSIFCAETQEKMAKVACFLSMLGILH